MANRPFFIPTQDQNKFVKRETVDFQCFLDLQNHKNKNQLLPLIKKFSKNLK